jgi:hypothetical protein
MHRPQPKRPAVSRRRMRSRLASCRPIAASVVAGASITGIHTMTRRAAKEILLKVGAGRERQDQSQDDPAEHDFAAFRFRCPRH